MQKIFHAVIVGFFGGVAVYISTALQGAAIPPLKALAIGALLAGLARAAGAFVGSVGEPAP